MAVRMWFGRTRIARTIPANEGHDGATLSHQAHRMEPGELAWVESGGDSLPAHSPVSRAAKWRPGPNVRSPSPTSQRAAPAASRAATPGAQGPRTGHPGHRDVLHGVRSVRGAKPHAMLDGQQGRRVRKPNFIEAHAITQDNSFRSNHGPCLSPPSAFRAAARLGRITPGPGAGSEKLSRLGYWGRSEGVGDEQPSQHVG
jgi:hypothetical protein